VRGPAERPPAHEASNAVPRAVASEILNPWRVERPRSTNAGETTADAPLDEVAPPGRNRRELSFVPPDAPWTLPAAAANVLLRIVLAAESQGSRQQAV
jgi:hypothetical protein